MLGEATQPRPRDMPDPVNERPSTMKRRARLLLRQAQACASTPGEEYDRLTQEAEQLLRKREALLKDPERAVNHPATQHTAKQWGAEVGAPLDHFPRALRRTLLDLGLSTMDADHFVRVEKKEEEEDKKPKAARRRR